MMIRLFRRDDFPRCRAIVNEVWKFTDIFAPKRIAELFLDVYTRGSLGASNFTVVIEEDGHVEGFLFGKCGHARTLRTKYASVLGGMTFLLHLFSVKGVTWKEKRTYISMLSTHEVNRRRAEPHRENEVNLFAVSPHTQGKGYGKALMAAYIQQCQEEHVTRVTLDTDNSCNYQFYEHFGYTKIAEFYSPIQELYSGHDGTSFVYELQVK